MARRPNVVMMVADDHRMGAIRAQGDPTVQTPTFDRLMAEGASFDQTYISGAFYGAVCAPSRASILTGNSVFSSTISCEVDTPRASETINPDLVMLPEAFRAAGYHTHAIGKWHNDPVSLNRAFASGSRLFFGGMSDHTAVPLRDYDPSGAYPAEAVTIGDGFSSEIFADAAIEFLDHAGDEPFFLYVAFTAPHDPRTPPEPFASRYAAADMPLPPNAWPQHPFDNGELRNRDERLAAMPRDPDEVRQHIADYYGMISHLDAQVGRILDALDAQGLAEDTIVVYTADHGLAVGQHGLMGKQNLYQHSIRVPLLMRGRGLPAGARVDRMTANIDTFPTLCALAGVAVPATVEGQTLLPLLASGEGGYDERFAAYRDVQRMVTDGRWKLIRYAVSGKTGEGVDAWQLFDLATDPWELDDRSGDESLHAERDRLFSRLAAWQRRVGDALVLPQASIPAVTLGQDRHPA
ncbi:MAG: sulfatase-like hydrolase/transferase [Thermomicrobiales bacterium]